MRVAIIGSRPEIQGIDTRHPEWWARKDRDYKRKDAVGSYVYALDEWDEFVSGGCDGPDLWGEAVAKSVHLSRVIFHPKWKLRSGRAFNAGGPKRNERMAAYADRCVAFFGAGESRGTEGCVAMFRRLGKPVEEWRFRPDGSYGPGAG